MVHACVDCKQFDDRVVAIRKEIVLYLAAHDQVQHSHIMRCLPKLWAEGPDTPELVDRVPTTSPAFRVLLSCVFFSLRGNCSIVQLVVLDSGRSSSVLSASRAKARRY